MLFQAGNSQYSTLSASDSIIRTLVSDSIKALTGGNTTKTLQNLNVVQQMLADFSSNSSTIMASKLLVNNALEAVRDNDSSRAIVYLNLVGQQFGVPSIPSTTNENKTGEFPTSVGTSNSSTFQSYYNPMLGVTMHYPADWTVHQYEYNAGTNSTLVGFYSPSKTASELGNLSGVSGHFVPYSDIFVFDSKNLTLDRIIDGKIKRLQNDTHSSIVESKPMTLKGGKSGYVIIYRTVAGGDELFQKIQAYTISGQKVYLISFTSQEASFPSYLPLAQKMINSFEAGNKSSIMK